MIDRIRNDGAWLFSIICETPGCGQFKEYPLATGFVDTVCLAKEDGWLIKKVAGVWEHYCNHCRTRIRTGQGTTSE